MTTETHTTEAPFVKYPSITNSYALDARFLARLAADNHTEFYATEKLHGSNFSLHYDGNSYDVFPARRNASLLHDEVFFPGWQEIHKEMSQNLAWHDFFYGEVFTTEPVKSVHVYGELFGEPVFPEMKYATRNGDLDWKVFSVLVTLQDGRILVPGLSTLREVFGEENLVPVVSQGGLTELLENLDMEAGSRLGGRSEGYVVMPVDDRVWTPGDLFFAIKHKTPGFSEVPTEKALRDLRALNSKAEVAAYLTVARLESVVSKGDVPLTRENIGRLIDLFIDDAFADYAGTLTASELASQRGALKGVAGKLIAETLRARSN